MVRSKKSDRTLQSRWKENSGVSQIYRGDLVKSVGEGGGCQAAEQTSYHSVKRSV